MKTIIPLVIISSFASYGAVVYDFSNGLILDSANVQVGTFLLTSQIGTGAPTTITATSSLIAIQNVGTNDIVFQGGGGDFNTNPTISLTITLTDPRFTLLDLVFASTAAVNGVDNGPNGGFNIGNVGNDVGLSFNVDGDVTTPNQTQAGIFDFDATNSDIQMDGFLAAGQIAAANSPTSGNHFDDTFLFSPTAPIGNGDTFEATVTSFGGSISGEAFRFDIDIAESVPEPSSSTLLALVGLGFLTRRKR